MAVQKRMKTGQRNLFLVFGLAMIGRSTGARVSFGVRAAERAKARTPNLEFRFCGRIKPALMRENNDESSRGRMSNGMLRSDGLQAKA